MTSKIDRSKVWCNHHTHSEAWENDLDAIVECVIREATDDEALAAFAREQERGTVHDDMTDEQRIVEGLRYLIEEAVPVECHRQNTGLTIEIGLL